MSKIKDVNKSAEQEASERRERALRIKKVADNLRGVIITGATTTNDESWEGQDAGDYIHHILGKGSQTISFNLADLERIIKHIKGDQYRGPG